MGACASAPKTRGDGAWDDDVHDTSGHDSSHSGRGGARWFAAEPVDVVTTFTGRGERFARSRRDVDDAERLRERVATKTSARKARPFKYASTGGNHVLSLDIDSDAAPPHPPPSAHHARTSSDGLPSSAHDRGGDSCGDESWSSSNHDSASSTVANAAAAACAETVDPPALNHVQPRNAHRRSRLSTTSASSERDRSTSNDAGSSDEHTSDDELVALEDARDDSGWPAWIERHAGDAIRQRRWLEPRDMQSYRRLDKVGQGTYSTVYRGQDLTDGRVVALKHIRLANMDDDSLEFMAREIDVLARLGSHPSVVSLLDVACGKTKSSMYLVFEYVEHDLAGLLSVAEKHSLRLGQVKRLASQLLSALSHCHARGVMHRDIKGSNLLVSDEGTLKLADFGLARRTPRGMEPLTNRVVTLWYRPPELLLGARAYDGAALDAWSAGCIIAELLHFSPILPGRTEVEQLHKIFKLCGSADAEEVAKRIELQNRALKAKAGGDGKKSSGKEDEGGGLAVGVPSPENAYRRTVHEKFESFPPDALDLVQKLLVVDPLKRLTAAQALEHPFFTNEPREEALNVSHVDPAHEYVVRRAQHMYRNYGAPSVQKVPLNETGGGNYEHVGARGILSKSPKYSPPKQEDHEGGGGSEQPSGSEAGASGPVSSANPNPNPNPGRAGQARGGGGPDVAVGSSAAARRASVRVVDLGDLGQSLGQISRDSSPPKGGATLPDGRVGFRDFVTNRSTQRRVGVGDGRVKTAGFDPAVAKAALLEAGDGDDGGGAGASKPRARSSPDEDEQRRQEYRARVKKEDSAKAMKRASMDTARL